MVYTSLHFQRQPTADLLQGFVSFLQDETIAAATASTFSPAASANAFSAAMSALLTAAGPRRCVCSRGQQRQCDSSRALQGKSPCASASPYRCTSEDFLGCRSRQQMQICKKVQNFLTINTCQRVCLTSVDVPMLICRCSCTGVIAAASQADLTLSRAVSGPGSAGASA